MSLDGGCAVVASKMAMFDRGNFLMCRCGLLLDWMYRIELELLCVVGWQLRHHHPFQKRQCLMFDRGKLLMCRRGLSLDFMYCSTFLRNFHNNWNGDYGMLVRDYCVLSDGGCGAAITSKMADRDELGSDWFVAWVGPFTPFHDDIVGKQFWSWAGWLKRDREC